eukprot:TRINITY_DN14389_c0_g1_i1.p1 TRINITY_DN14389_c0_g1~~TRINITY_DN14389_c0_g1_i1.p1  ORF type:complete len:110 (+),score=17.30 TRINITY_DN14389_c0_g1_i1:265-594(+)
MPSTNTTTDAALGVGVYFTTKPPQCSNQTLAKNNYNNTQPHFVERTQYYVRVPMDAVPGVQCVTGERKVCLASGSEPFSLPPGTKFGERKRTGSKGHRMIFSEPRVRIR